MVRRILLNAAAISLFAVTAAPALAAPTATVALDTNSSGCEFGRLLITTANISGERQVWRATWSDSVTKDFVLGESEEAGPAGGYSGGLDFPFLTGPVPFGIVVTLYGYQGSTPPTPATTAEFSVTYVCDTLEILASSAGPYGTITPLGLPNYEGLWWKSPSGSESGWGINLAHQGDVIFATWFTYDVSGKAWWFSMTADKSAENTYAGILYQTHGPAFSAVPFNPAAVSLTAVGTGTLTFSDGNSGSFTYTVNGVNQIKAITRQVFATLPICAFGAQTDLAQAVNYQDLWWAAPAGMESGWGVNFTHQSDTLFATWFTYDFDGTPLWLSVTAPKTGSGVYAGTLYRTTGPAFNAVPFDPAKVVRTPVGTLTITFANGNAASFAYSVMLSGVASTVTQTKQITRQVFRAPGTICH